MLENKTHGHLGEDDPESWNKSTDGKKWVREKKGLGVKPIFH